MSAQREWTFGMNRVCFEPPDLVVAKFTGTTHLEEAQRTIDIYREVGSHQPFFLIADISESLIDTPARDYLIQHGRPEWLLGVAYVGAGLVQRAATKAMAIALYVSGRSPLDCFFANTEAEARVLYERKRREWLSRVA